MNESKIRGLKWNPKKFRDQFCILTIFIKFLQCAVAKVDHSTSNVKKKKNLT